MQAVTAASDQVPLGFDAHNQPIHTAKAGYMYTAACVACRSCGGIIRAMGGPMSGSICLTCHEKEAPTGGSGLPQPTESDLRQALREVVAVSICVLFESFPDDVKAVFTTAELEEVLRAACSRELQSARVEDVYKKAWEMLKPSANLSVKTTPG